MFSRKFVRTLAAVGAFTSCMWAQTQKPAISPVEGESWLTHLHRSFDDTSMGKTGRLGPATPANDGSLLPIAATQHSEIMHGEDVYRMNCRGCHGEAGLGAPPEINSVINPVRSTSAALMIARMKQTGMEISRSDADKMAVQSRDALLQRIHKGGKDMPAFPQIDEAEVRALMAYLKLLADVPGAKSEQLAVTESPLRVGEQIVKSTCHICHSAAGANPTADQMMAGAIPPLSVLTTRVTQAQLVRKVTQGATVEMGTPVEPYRGRMPVFYYLTEQEAADVYSYLSTYRPEQKEPVSVVMASIAPTSGGGGNPPGPRVLAASLAPDRTGAKAAQASELSESLVLLAVVAMLVSLLLAGGVGFTLRECMRLSAIRDRRVAKAKAEKGFAAEIDRQVA